MTTVAFEQKAVHVFIQGFSVGVQGRMTAYKDRPLTLMAGKRCGLRMLEAGHIYYEARPIVLIQEGVRRKRRMIRIERVKHRGWGWHRIEDRSRHPMQERMSRMTIVAIRTMRKNSFRTMPVDECANIRLKSDWVVCGGLQTVGSG